MSSFATTTRLVVMIGTAIDTQGGISTVVRVLKEAGLFERCNVCYLPTHCDGGTIAKLTAFFVAWIRFLGLLLTGNVGVLHAHTASRASFWRKSLFIVPTLLARVPVILHLHGAEFYVFYGKECSAWSRRFVRWVFEQASQVVVLSQSWREWVQTTFPEARVRVIPNPILIPDIPLIQGRQPCALLFLGRLGQRKGVYDLLQAVSLLVSRYPNLKVWLGGDGELDIVRDRAASLGIGGYVQVLGWVKGADKTRLLDEASVYVLPSYNEGLPMSVLEAMAHGLPVVATPVGGIPEALRDGEEGFLVAPGDIEGLADRLDRLLANPDLRARMGEAARQRAISCFGADGIVKQWVALYRELGWSCTGTEQVKAR
jgi:glycosyltransferase involved in cell wall biosynthesis